MAWARGAGPADSAFLFMAALHYRHQRKKSANSNMTATIKMKMGTEMTSAVAGLGVLQAARGCQGRKGGGCG